MKDSFAETARCEGIHEAIAEDEEEGDSEEERNAQQRAKSLTSARMERREEVVDLEGMRWRSSDLMQTPSISEGL